VERVFTHYSHPDHMHVRQEQTPLSRNQIASTYKAKSKDNGFIMVSGSEGICNGIITGGQPQMLF
jgi:hypothetical protein